MPRRGYEERPVATGVASFDAPAPPPGANLAPLDFGGLQRALQTVVTQELEREDERAFEAGRAAQLEADPSDPATESSRVRRRVVDAWERGRNSVMSEQIKLDATRTAGELLREHRNNPEGFLSAWESYSKGVNENLRRTSPALANDLSVSLSQYGATAHERLVENQFNRELQMQAQTVVDTLNSRIAVFEDIVLANPDEQLRRETLDEIRMVAQAEFEAGLISAEQASAVTRAAQQRLSQSYYRGQFNQSLESGDLAGAQSVIDALLRGEGFEDNEQGRRLANSLGQDLQAMMRGESMSDQVRLFMDNLKDVRDNVKHGMPLTQDLFDAAEAQMNFVIEHGTPLQQKNAQQEFQNILSMRSASEWIDNAPINLLQDFGIEELQGLTREARNSLFERSKRRYDDLRTFEREGNELRAGGDLSWRVGAEAVAERKQLAEYTYGKPLMNAWTSDEVSRTAADFNDALSQGNVVEAQAIADGSLRIFGSLSQQIHEGLRHGTAAAPMSLYSLLAASGADVEATQALQYIGLARNVERPTATILSETKATARHITDDSDFQEIAMAMAAGDRNLANRYLNVFVDMYAGILADRELRGEPTRMGLLGGGTKGMAKPEMMRLLTPFTDVVRFDNGTALPAFYLGEQRLDRREVERRVNAFYENPREFGFRLDVTENLRELTAPRVMTNGQIGFYTPEGFLTDLEGNVISIDPEAAAEFNRQQEAKAARQQAEHAATFGRPVAVTGQEAFEQLSSKSQSLTLGSLATSAAESFGTRSDVVSAIHYAGLNMNPADVGPRVHFMLTADSVTESNWGRVRDAIDVRVYRGDKEGAINSPDAAAFLAADRFAQAETKYPNDLEAQLAAYWMGFDSFSTYKRNAGDNWFRDLPLPAKKFIENVKQRLD